MECDDSTPGGVPSQLTEPLTEHLVCMVGTKHEPVRCVALLGTVADIVRCSIYEQRASVCREFPASWVDGVRNDRCDQARAVHGLAPLTPDDLHESPTLEPPRAA
jgi:hypothetical protein